MRVPAATGHQAIAASALSRRDIESTITFLSEKRVFADDPAMQVMQFGYLRDPSSAPPCLVNKYKKHQRVALKLMSLLIRGEHGAWFASALGYRLAAPVST